MKSLLKNTVATMALGAALMVSAPAVMANTYYLTDSNVLADGVNYAQVDVTENSGNLAFTVKALQPTNWKFANFYFNLAPTVSNVSINGLPTGWSANNGQNVSEFGVFSNGEKGTGNSLQSTLSFIVDATANLTLASLATNSRGWLFAAHMQCQGNQCSSVGGETSQFVAGPSPVPLPAAAWLFGSSLIGFAAISSRRRV